MAHRPKKRKPRGGNKKKTFKRKFVFFVAAILAVMGAAVYYTDVEYLFIKKSTPQSDVYIMKGIDISHHNPIPDWQKLEEEGVDFVYMKATEGTTHEDQNYPHNYEQARQSTIRMGAYHFYSFGVSGRDQAKHFIRVAKSKAGDLIPVIDVEHSAQNPYSKDKEYIKKIIGELKELEDEMHQHYGVHPVIYTNKECYRLYVENHFPNNMMWIVDLDREPTEIENWRIWQYSHTGKVSGIKGHTDLNYYRYTTKEFAELLLPH